MKFKRIISTFLAVLMLVSAFTIATSAEETATNDGHVAEPAGGWKTSSSKPTLYYFTGEGAVADSVSETGEVTKWKSDGTKVINSAEDKLEYMDLRFIKDGYELYVDAYSGEVATRCIATGEILFTNPYTIGDSTATPTKADGMSQLKNKPNEGGIKAQLMSQLVVKYIDVTSGEDNTYHSFAWASSKGQIVVRNIKNGIRVEYTIGREEARLLVPVCIEKSAFESKIIAPMIEALNLKLTHGYYTSANDVELLEGADVYMAFTFKTVMAYYDLQDPSKLGSESLKEQMYTAFPITKKMAIYTLDTITSDVEKANIENLIKTYCPEYTYEELDADHLLTEYEAEDKNPPLFKMALEYTLDEQGLAVRLPANGLRFNEALYQVYSIEILPYMGAGASSNNDGNFAIENSGYTFFPDGSGTLFDFNKINDLGSSTTVTGKVYGQDYAYHTITGTHQEILRYPVFGIVETERREAEVTANNGGGTGTGDESNTVKTEKSRGFVAIVEEGDALMELSSYHAVTTNEYNTVRMIVYPRPQDTYNVADAISVGSNDTWTVVSSRKYTGNYKIRYIMLTDNDVAAEKGIADGDYYDCTYVGMAKAYREYLESEGVLTRLTAEDVEEDIPLYIETFGSLLTTQRFLSIPVDVVTPLTTFDDIVTMHTELAEKGVKNINFIMTGYTDGGLEYEKVPYNLKWENAVEGEYDFEELLEYARANGIELFPDFNFAYVSSYGWFDGLSLKKHAVKTIDDRYSSRREYSATKQTYVSYFDLALSPAYYSHFYKHFTEDYLKYDPIGISVSTLGNSLNSDFDEDEPYNREDSKNFTVKAFQYLAENYDKVMTSGGNAYTWKYIDYITDVALDSSRYAQSAASVPFLGMVLHGYVEFAGTPINMEGNIDYAILKAIENGASLKFILSYQNTSHLKDNIELSKYYSVRYDIWFNDVIDLYTEINEALKDVQTSVIVEHEFIEGTRIPDDDEIITDAMNAIDAAIANENALQQAQTESEINAFREARQEIANAVATLRDAKDDAQSSYGQKLKNYNDTLAAATEYIATIDAMSAEINALKADVEANPDDLSKQTLYAEKVLEYNGYVESVFTMLYTNADSYISEMISLCETYNLITDTYKPLIEADTKLSDAKRAELLANIDKLTEGADIICADNDYKAELAKIVADVNVVADEIVAHLLDPTTAPADFGYKLEEDEEVIVDEKVTVTDYETDDNKIVYEVYENGTAFILNFNNYSVRVTVNNTVYTLGAYGYIVLKPQN